MSRIFKVFLVALIALALPFSASAQEEKKLKVVATFSILGDMALNVGQDKIDLKVLVGPNADSHSYSPTPDDMKAVGAADVFIVNGLEFDPWFANLVQGSGFKGEVVVASFGVKPISAREQDNEQESKYKKNLKMMGDRHDHYHRSGFDPHAWQNLGHARTYVANIARGFSKVDPANEAFYNQNAITYRAQLKELNDWAVKEFRSIPEQQRKMVSSHDALQYFARAYGIDFMSPQGISSFDEPSAAEIAKLVDTIKKDNIKAVFFESMSNHALIEQIAKETGVKVGAELYTDALSEKDGKADTFVNMFRYNVQTIAAAMRGQNL